MKQNSWTWRRIWATAVCLAMGGGLTGWGAVEPGQLVVVIYNTRLPESKKVADHYAERRQVPPEQLLGFDLPTGESMTRVEFVGQLQKPLIQALQRKKLMNFAEANGGVGRVTAATVRYAALCYGVPLRILKDPTVREAGDEGLQPELQRNEASVDSELACLPVGRYRLAGTAANPGYGATNTARLDPTNGVWMVTRLDGPSVAVALGLVDKALLAERDGLWGRGYFDARGITEGGFKLGDDWIRAAAVVTRNAGFEVELDEKPDTFPASFPMSQIAFYAGWYDWNVSGPFTRPPVEFMPGALAYHLHSFSAQTIRATNVNWVGPLLAAGATATMGCVDEPYLSGTPDLGTFFSRIYLGYSFGEAACAAQGSLSWQIIAVGDPLYRPFHQRPQLVHEDLERRGSSLVEWSHLRLIDRNLNAGTPRDEIISYLLPLARQSAVLTEKLGDLYLEKNQLSDALDLYRVAVLRGPSPQQKVRLLLTRGRLLTRYGRTREAFELYEQFLKDYPNYPDPLFLYQTILPLAEKNQKQEMVERCQREIKRLSTPAPAKL